jgi:hypothetical protein
MVSAYSWMSSSTRLRTDFTWSIEGWGGSARRRIPSHEQTEEMTRDAGFTRFERLKIDHPVNAFYVVRP